MFTLHGLPPPDLSHLSPLSRLILQIGFILTGSTELSILALVGSTTYLNCSAIQRQELDRFQSETFLDISEV